MDPRTAQLELFASLAEPFTGEALFDGVSDVVYFVKDSAGRYVVVNRTLVTRCGRQGKEEVLGRTAEELYSSPLGEQYRAQDEEVLASGQPLLNELELHPYAGGGRGWCLTTKLPLRGADGRCVGLVGMSRDLQAPDESAEEYVQVAAAVRYARDHLAEPLVLEDLAAVAGLSGYQFDQRVRRVFHLSAGQLLLKFRMDLATQRLRDTADAISAIALESGYSDQSAFTRQFRKTTGMTPGEYRRAYATRAVRE